MELIIFASLEVLYFYTHFFILGLSIYVPGRSGVAFPLDFSGEKFRGPWTLSGARLGSAKEQWQTWGCKAPSFRWATFGWASCNIDSFVLHV